MSYVYIVIAEDYEDYNDCDRGLVRKVYGVYLIETMADYAVVEAKEKHDYAFVERHFVE